MSTKYGDLWGWLSAEFEAREVRTRPGGKGVTFRYLTARAVLNRLDTVLGPENWWAEYRDTARGGVVCRLTIRLPDGQCLAKEAAGAPAEMGNTDDSEASAYSHAFKRAAAAFGVGRYLYGEGTVDYGESTATQAESLAPRQKPFTAWLNEFVPVLGLEDRWPLYGHIVGALEKLGFSLPEAGDKAGRIARYKQVAALYDGGHPEWVDFFNNCIKEYAAKHAAKVPA